MNIDELENLLEGALARIKRLEDALLAVSMDADAGQTAINIALQALKTEDDATS